MARPKHYQCTVCRKLFPTSEAQARHKIEKHQSGVGVTLADQSTHFTLNSAGDGFCQSPCGTFRSNHPQSVQRHGNQGCPHSESSTRSDTAVDLTSVASGGGHARQTKCHISIEPQDIAVPPPYNSTYTSRLTRSNLSPLETSLSVSPQVFQSSSAAQKPRSAAYKLKLRYLMSKLDALAESMANQDCVPELASASTTIVDLQNRVEKLEQLTKKLEEENRVLKAHNAADNRPSEQEASLQQIVRHLPPAFLLQALTGGFVPA